MQVRVAPGRLYVDYVVSLNEFTLLRDLKRLDDSPTPAASREETVERYGRIVAPLNAAGLLITIDGQPLPLEIDEIRTRVESHLVYDVTYVAPLPDSGRLEINDTNYLSSPGERRLAVSLRAGVETDDPLPTGESRPKWRMTDAEELQTRRVTFAFRPAANVEPAVDPEVAAELRPASLSPSSTPERPAPTVSRLDLSGRWAWVISWLVAVALGGVHAILPGHGKLVVAGVAASDQGHRGRPFALAAIVSATHLASVAALAVGLVVLRGWSFSSLDRTLKLASGALLLLLASYRIGRMLGGPLQADGRGADLVSGRLASSGWWMAGVAAGLIPCWDAVLLLLTADSQGRLALGLWLVAGFSLGLLLVQLAVAATARRLGRAPRGDRGQRLLGAASAVVLGAIGLTLLSR